MPRTRARTVAAAATARLTWPSSPGGARMSATALACFVAMFVAVSAVAFAGRLAGALTGGRRDDLPTLVGWGLADRRLGTVMTWFLLGGTIYTVYTFLAVPYTVIVYPIAFLVLPRLWRVARDNDLLTPADIARARYSSPALAAAVACCGILATMPYVALQ